MGDYKKQHRSILSRYKSSNLEYKGELSSKFPLLEEKIEKAADLADCYRDYYKYDFYIISRIS